MAMTIVADAMTMMLCFSGAEGTSKKGESEEREQRALHLKILQSERTI
jgi:hypothetical protein